MKLYVFPHLFVVRAKTRTEAEEIQGNMHAAANYNHPDGVCYFDMEVGPRVANSKCSTTEFSGPYTINDPRLKPL